MQSNIKIQSADADDDILISFVVPKQMTGKYTYDETMSWTMPAVCVYINRVYSEYTLNHTIYLDYKDSLQVGRTILNFDSREEAEAFAKKHSLTVEYG
jgi:hypothetical protein